MLHAFGVMVDCGADVETGQVYDTLIGTRAVTDEPAAGSDYHHGGSAREGVEGVGWGVSVGVGGGVGGVGGFGCSA